MLLKQKPANIRKWIARFYYFRHLYSAGSACVAHNNCMSCPSIWATLSALLINTLLGSFQLFYASDQPLSEGEIIPFSGVCQSGGGCIIHAGGVGSFTHWLTDCFDVQPTTTSGNIITWASFSALASANSFVYFASSAATSRWRICMSVVTFASFSSAGIFVALGFVGVNGVITVMINSPWQADDDADNQSGDNRGDSAHTSISLTVPPASLNFANRLSALCSNWP